ncbi:MAG: tetratricopeptide repeat protein [Planctomycetota bacterium]
MIRLTAGVAALLLAGSLSAQDPRADSDPVDVTTLQARARAAEQAGQHDTAGDLYAQLAALQPERAEWALAAAASWRAVERFNEALDVLEASAQRAPENVDLAAGIATTYHLKAEAMLGRGVRDANVLFQFEEAARVAEAALRRHPSERRLRVLLAQSQFQLGDFGAARVSAEEVVRRFPLDPGGHLLVGQVAFAQLMQLRGEEAQIAGEPERQDLRQRGDAVRDRAAEAFAKVARLDPTRARPHVQLGNLWGREGNDAAALQHYRDALSIDAGATVNHHWVSTKLEAEQRVAWYDRVLADYRKQPGANDARAGSVLWWRAFALFEQREYPAAKDAFLTAIAANPGFANSRAYAMLAAYWSDDHGTAEREAALYAAEGPRHFADHLRDHTDPDESVPILEYLAHRSYRARRLGRARDLNHVVAMVLDTADHWNNYAFLCRETGRYAASLDAYRNALSLEPTSPQLLNDAAVILHYHLAEPHHLAEAKQLYQRASEEAKKVLANASATSTEKSRARQAMADARANLRKL